MAARLTDRQKKKIIADYLELGSYQAAGRRNKVSDGTVKRVVMESGDIEQKIAQKKDENTADILEYMDKKRGDVRNLIDLYLAEMAKPEKVKKSGVQSLAVSLGIVIDKFTGTATELEKLKAEIAKLRGEGQKQEVHPLVSDLVAALKKRQEDSHAE